jgi:SAM-dependent methyltransferase
MNENSTHFDCLIPLMRAKGVGVTPEEFHRIVNVTFHKFESAHYDEFHLEMWTDLPAQCELIAQDLVSKSGGLPDKSRLLDIGCGTGLSTELLLKSPLGKSIAHVDLVDTSPEMLEKCAKRAAGWGIEYKLTEGTIREAPGAGYDLIVTCSVLHHIPDLNDFFAAVRRLQAPRGVFLHFQDPNGDYLDDPDLLRRSESLRQARKKPAASRGPLNLPLRLARRAWRKLTGTDSSRRKNYVDEINAALIAKGVIKSPMTDAELWSVTDIHENNLPFSTGKGISLKHLAELMPDYEMVTARSYSFFGKMIGNLPPEMKEEELRLVKERAMNGKHIEGAWRLRASRF